MRVLFELDKKEQCVMGKSKDLKYRAVCPECGKGFDTRYEGFKHEGKLICAKCFHAIPFVTYPELRQFHGKS